jgi:hypothetical protein
MAVVKHQQPRNIEGAMRLMLSRGLLFCSVLLVFLFKVKRPEITESTHYCTPIGDYSIYELLPPLPVLLVCAPTVGASASQRQNTRERERERERKKEKG